MPDGMTTPGVAEAGQQQQLLQQLLQRTLQPHRVGPQVQPEMLKAEQSRAAGMTSTQGLVHNLFGLIYQSAQHNKQLQLAHATTRIKGIADAVTTAYDIAQGDEGVAHEKFMQSPAVISLMSKEGQKDMRQMEKLLQADFLNPEKNKTVWHEALAKVIQLSGAEKVMAGLRKLMGQHKDQIAQKVQQSDKEMHSQMEARDLAEFMFKGARPVEGDTSKLVTSLIGPITREEAAAQLETQRQTDRKEIEKMKEQHADIAAKMKDPVGRKIAEAFVAFDEGDNEKGQKLLDLANKGAMAKKGPTETLTGWIGRSISGSPEEKAAAEKKIKEYMNIQGSLLTQRGLSFGMGRLNQYVDQDGVMGEPGGTVVMNGFQLQDMTKGTGGRFTMVGTINPQMELATQQVVRTSLPALKALEGDLDAYDNASDRAIIARTLRANPEVKALDENSLGVWINQNLISQLSPKGKALSQHLAVAAESLGRIRTLTGQSSTGMNTQLILSMLPGEETPSKVYGQEKLTMLYNLIDGLTQAPILGAAPKAGVKKGTKGATAQPKKGNPLDLPGL